MKYTYCSLMTVIFLIFNSSVKAQNNSIGLAQVSYDSLKFRNVGPAFKGGRISDIVIDQNNDNVWYVAAASGGVWKSKNAGTTWNPIFDGQSSFSIGCVTIDPSDNHTIWVGTGENNASRHVDFGDGIYKSTNSGKSWNNMGLKKSEHISKIIVDPENSEVIWVAVQGPLWNKGGQRGMYKSTDGGQTWENVLSVNKWTGATDVVVDPRNPNILYAATWQRARTVAAFIGGGQGSGIYKSTDGGENWKKLNRGLPETNVGKIGLAISPEKPDIVYATIRVGKKGGGFYMSHDKGSSWEKMSNTVSGNAYYQELFASPHQFGTIYLMDTHAKVSHNNGKSFHPIQAHAKHTDNHAMAFRSEDPDFLLMGTDGGLYESFDGSNNWWYLNNLPITQFYHVSVDNAKPFYNIYGGTQDNSSQGGPFRTANDVGIQNSDWYTTLFADGYGSATEPGNPNIFYAEAQNGRLYRIDRITNDKVLIKPPIGKKGNTDRFNWDAPFIISPHKSTRLYFGSQRVWKSNNRGDSWTAISGDLTRNQERLNLPIMGRQQNYDMAWGLGAMSNYNTITALAESPIHEGLIYAGTDDGLIQITNDDGENWRKVDLKEIKSVPNTAVINDIKADLFDAKIVYVTLDNHKHGDFKPYLLKSTDQGHTWKSISGNLPENHFVWSMVQDDADKNLLFVGTEFGIYFTTDGGNQWIKLSGGLPTNSFHDITIQRKRHDLVGASFGRSIFVLDDYTPLRHINKKILNKDAVLFPPRDAYWYIDNPLVESDLVNSKGSHNYIAPNPPFGALFTYYLKNDYKSLKAKRKQTEKTFNKQNKVFPFPGWKHLDRAIREKGPKVFITIKNENDEIVNKIEGPVSEGFHRINWKLNYPNRKNPKHGVFLRIFDTGYMVTPGTYTATLSKFIRGNVTQLSKPVIFNIIPLQKGALKRKSDKKFNEFRISLKGFQQSLYQVNNTLQKQLDEINSMGKAAYQVNLKAPKLIKQINETRLQLLDLNEEMHGSEAKSKIGEHNPPTLLSYLNIGFQALRSTYGPTPAHFETLNNGKERLDQFKSKLNEITNVTMPNLKHSLKTAGIHPVEYQ